MNIEGMSDELKRIRIAEACGWIKFWQPSGDDENAGCGHWEWHKGNVNVLTVPDYLNDLNAMHVVEEEFCFEIDEYIERLGEIVRAYWVSKGKKVEEFDQQSVIFAHAHATARQRADAFLLTLP